MKNFEHDFILPPFPGFPSASRFVALGSVLETFNRVSRSILAREAISLVIGPPGTGKSLVLALLSNELAPSHDVVVLGETSISDKSSFYRFLLHRLGVALESGKRDDLELLVHDRLCGSDAKPNGTVLLIDEADSLSSEVLDVIRRLTNMMRNGQPMVSAVVAGGVRLDETLTAPSMESFIQRVTARCYLHPLNADEARQYIRESIQACDASADDTITDRAISAIYHASNGVPRLINQLMTEAIDCAAERNEALIDETVVNRAWASLLQLPSPMTEEPTLKPECSVVEFGELVDPLPISSGPSAADELKSQLYADSIRRAEQEADEVLAATNELRMNTPAALADPFSLFGSLFGDFENEEKIEVGAANVRIVPSEAPSFDIESMLHSQIVSLSQFAAENTSARYSELNSIAMFKENPGQDSYELMDDLQFNDEIELMDEDDTHQAMESAESGTVGNVVWYDEPDRSMDPMVDDRELLHDDSDLLWITEDIDVDRRVVNPAASLSPHRVDQAASPDAPKLSVDYREMLEKMRNQA